MKKTFLLLILALFLATPAGAKTFTVSASADDAQELGGTVTIADTTIGASLDATTEWAAFRVLNVDIPKNAKILTAVAEVVPSATAEDEPLVTVYLEAADNCATFTTAASSISSRSRTTGVSWSSTNMGADGATYFATPSLVADVQAIVNRADWALNNAMCVIFQGGATSTRDLTIEAYDLGPGTNPPRLVITWLACTGGIPMLGVGGAC